jgi:hypothetical protein
MGEFLNAFRDVFLVNRKKARHIVAVEGWVAAKRHRPLGKPACISGRARYQNKLVMPIVFLQGRPKFVE